MLKIDTLRSKFSQIFCPRGKSKDKGVPIHVNELQSTEYSYSIKTHSKNKFDICDVLVVSFIWNMGFKLKINISVWNRSAFSI